MKYFLTVLCAVMAVLAGCSGPPPVVADQLEEREDGLMYFEGEPFTGVASSKKEDFSIMTDYKDGKAISSRYWNKYGILTKEPTMNAGTKAPVLVAGEELKQHEALTRKQAGEEQKRNQELARKHAEEKQKQNEELTSKRAEVERKRIEELARKHAEEKRKQNEELARKRAEESVKAIPKIIDFDDPGTRRKIAESAIYKNQSQRRGNKGEELLYFRDNTTPYSGWWKEMRGKGKGYNFETLVQYKDGKRDGPMAHWYKNGQKKLENTYKDGKKHGLSRGWYDNGKKWWEETYEDGNWDGLRTNWYDNGQKKSESTYKDGELSTAVAWKRNGEKCPVTNVVNGNGNWVRYNNDGRVVVLWTFKDGSETESLWTQWHSNGKKSREATYRDGEKMFTSTWYENEQKRYDHYYKDNKPNGLWTQWHSNGKKEEEVTYKDGRKNGPTRGWHQNGQQKWERPYKDGERDGSSTWWYSNGQKEEESTWKDGKLITYVVWKRNGEECPVTNIVNGNGVLVKYHDNGKQKRIETFKDGKRVK